MLEYNNTERRCQPQVLLPPHFSFTSPQKFPEMLTSRINDGILSEHSRDLISKIHTPNMPTSHFDQKRLGEHPTENNGTPILPPAPLK